MKPKARTKVELALMDELIPLLKNSPRGGRFQGWGRMSNKVGKRGLVPKLRFPEFRAAGEWSK